MPQGLLLVVREFFEFFVEELLEPKEKPAASTLTLVRSTANKQLAQTRRQFMSFNLLAPAVFYRYTASKHTPGHHISTTILALPWSGFHQLATTFVKLLPFLDHELVS